MLIGEVLTFIPGLIWLQHATGKDWSWTFSAGFTPFILGEAIKISLAAVTLPTIWKVVDKRRS
jgi:biotin transport system substrate-specific component